MIWPVFSPLMRPPTLIVPAEPPEDEVEESRFEAPPTEESELMGESRGEGNQRADAARGFAPAKPRAVTESGAPSSLLEEVEDQLRGGVGVGEHGGARLHQH